MEYKAGDYLMYKSSSGVIVYEVISVHSDNNTVCIKMVHYDLSYPSRLSPGHMNFTDKRALDAFTTKIEPEDLIYLL